jgi:hypothetical protein
VDPPVVIDPPKKLLEASDFIYIGSALLPKTALGKSTAYAPGVLALKRVDNNLTFYSDSHESIGRVYSFTLPELSKDVPKQVRVTGNINVLPGVETHQITMNGLRYDDHTKGLIWTCGINYNTGSQYYANIGMADPLYGKTVGGPYNSSEIPALQRRGGTLRIPNMFAIKYTNSNTLAAGFGGYYSIIDGGSAGPCLSVFKKTPGDNNIVLEKRLLYYPWNTHPCVRPKDYEVTTESWVGHKGGLWTAADEIGGENHAAGAAWLDLDEAVGVAFWTYQGVGSIRYDEGGIHADGYINRLYLYDPEELGMVAKGQIKPWEPIPLIYQWNPPAKFNMFGRIAGVAVDRVTNIVYTLQCNAYKYESEYYPAIHAYQLPY